MRSSRRTSFGRLGARNQNASDDQVGGTDLLQDVVPIGVDQRHVGRHDVGEVAQTLERHVEHRYLGAESGGHLGGVDADHAATDDHDLGRRHARDAAQQDAAAAVELLEVLGPFLHRHPASDFRHGREERQLTVRELHCLVRDADCAAVHVRPGQLLIGGKMEVREDHLALLHTRPFRPRWAP